MLGCWRIKDGKSRNGLLGKSVVEQCGIEKYIESFFEGCFNKDDEQSERDAKNLTHIKQDAFEEKDGSYRR